MLRKNDLWALIAFLPGLAAASEPSPWLRQANLDSLGLFVFVKDCPMPEESVTSMAEGEFLRARLKPTRSLAMNLTVNVICSETETTEGRKIGYSAAYHISFGTRAAGTNVLFEEPSAFGLLSGGPDGARKYFLEALREQVSDLLTDYLKENVK
jgi:hypothetical protein